MTSTSCWISPTVLKKEPLKVIALKVNEIPRFQVKLPHFLLQNGLGATVETDSARLGGITESVLQLSPKSSGTNRPSLSFPYGEG